MNHYIPIVAIHPSYISVYSELAIKDCSYYNNEKDNRLDQMLSSNRRANGWLSDNAKRKMTKAIDYLLYLSKDKLVHNRLTGKTFKFKVAFVTLTLSSKQIHTDNEIRNLLINQLFVELKRYHSVKNYVWRAEKQINGNIHFHILVDRFVPWWELRNRWNRIQNKLGYVDRFREKMERQNTGRKKVEWNNPNSVDIHSLYQVKNIKKYLCKYLSKNVKIDENKSPDEIQKLLVKGRLWGSNQQLAKITGAKIPMDSEIEKEVERLVELSKADVYKQDYCTMIFIDAKKLIKYGATKLKQIFDGYISEAFESQEYTPQISISPPI